MEIYKSSVLDGEITLTSHRISFNESVGVLSPREEIEVVYISGGRGICRYNMADFPALVGDIFVFPAFSEHYFFSEKENIIKFQSVRFRADYLQSLGFGYELLHNLRKHRSGFVPRIYSKNIPGELAELWKYSFGEVQNNHAFSDLGFMGAIVSIISFVLSLTEAGTKEHQNEIEKWNAVKECTKYISQHFNEDINLDELSNISNLSKSYFLKVFREINGISPYEYVLKKRITFAADCLKKTDKSILDIAYLSGFNSKSCFNRAFLRIINKTPSEYRKSYKERNENSMSERYYLAVDLGASSGRFILGHLSDGKIITEEVYRFDNYMVVRDGKYCWDTEAILSHLKKGLKHCLSIGKKPLCMGIDTWGVDYVLLDEKDRVIGDTYAYRDPKNNGMTDEFFKIIPEEELYKKTGTKAQDLNTLFQLYETKLHRPDDIKSAKRFLMMPDYLNFLLTGVKMNEYTEASTSNMLSAETGTWDEELLDILGFEKGVFGKLNMPGTRVGELREDIKNEIGYDLTVYLTTSHDTASAVLAVPSRDNDTIFISSGTWAILGIETERAIVSEEGFKADFTNEGCFGGRNRYLRNINGMWFVQSVRNELGRVNSFTDLEEMARENEDFPSTINVADERFLAPESMIKEIKAYCRETNQPVPETLGQIMQVIFRGLSDCYYKNLKLLENITGRTFKAINIVGGGSMNTYLDELTAKKCGIPVYAGPTECSAIGNLLAQMLSVEDIPDVFTAKSIVGNSFDMKIYK